MDHEITTILLVDDSTSNIIALESLLEKEGRQFLTATNGNDALKIARSNQLDLIILDVQMAGMDGFEVAQILKSSSKTKGTPIIFASANNKEQDSILKGFEEGAIDYLLKPLNPEITKAKVSILLENQFQKRQLLEQNRLLEINSLLINNSADIIGIVDANTLKIENINNAVFKLLGYTPEEATGISLHRFIQKKELEGILVLVAAKPEELTFESRIVTKSGQEKNFQWNVTIKDGKWFINARDITKQKVAELQVANLNVDLEKNLKKLEDLNSDLESFSYSVSHDLMAPVRAINSYMQIYEEEYGSKLDEEETRLVQIVKRNAIKMRCLIEDLLHFSKLGRTGLKMQVTDMKAIVENTLIDLRNSKSPKAVVNINDIEPAFGDPAMLALVWGNLLSNAVKYSSKNANPVINIDSRIEGEEIIYTVSDNGVGFDMDYASKLFAVFQRLHVTKDFEGNGIGLALVERIVSRHSGRVWAEGEVNKGAKFYFSLPLVPDQSSELTKSKIRVL